MVNFIGTGRKFFEDRGMFPEEFKDRNLYNRMGPFFKRRAYDGDFLIDPNLLKSMVG